MWGDLNFLWLSLLYFLNALFILQKVRFGLYNSINKLFTLECCYIRMLLNPFVQLDSVSFGKLLTTIGTVLLFIEIKMYLLLLEPPNKTMGMEEMLTVGNLNLLVRLGGTEANHTILHRQLRLPRRTCIFIKLGIRVLLACPHRYVLHKNSRKEPLYLLIV